MGYIANFTPSRERTIRYRFDKFCRKVLSREAKSFFRAVKRICQHEVSLSWLGIEDAESYYTDVYPSEQHHFDTQGFVVQVENDVLASALAELPEESRDTILLYFFLGMKDEAISEKMGIPRSTVNYRRNSSLKKLKKRLEEIMDGKGRT